MSKGGQKQGRRRSQVPDIYRAQYVEDRSGLHLAFGVLGKTDTPFLFVQKHVLPFMHEKSFVYI